MKYPSVLGRWTNLTPISTHYIYTRYPELIKGQTIMLLILNVPQNPIIFHSNVRNKVY